MTAWKFAETSSRGETTDATSRLSYAHDMSLTSDAAASVFEEIYRVATTLDPSVMQKFKRLSGLISPKL